MHAGRIETILRRAKKKTKKNGNRHVEKRKRPGTSIALRGGVGAGSATVSPHGYTYSYIWRF